MLPKDLLDVKKRKPTIRPRFRELEEYRAVAADVIAIYEQAEAAGDRRGEVDDAVAALETHETFKLIRGLSTLLDRRARFEAAVPLPPPTLREAAFERGFVTSEDERQDVIRELAAEFDLTTDAIDRGLWADREEHEILTSAPAVTPEELLRAYNLSLAQTLLFDAVELEFTVSDNYQEIFGLVKYLGLMYTVDAELAVTVTGPASLFKRTRKYGTSLAKLVPAIMKADEWHITAQVETEVSGETRIYQFDLDADEEHRFPDHEADERFDSEVERDFATRIDTLADGWTVIREPTILRAGTRVMIPDFSFERDRGAGHPAFYLEVVGFWTPDYLEEKLEKVRSLESDYPVMLAVNESLNCTDEDFADANVDEVFYYDDAIPVKPVLSRLTEIDERHVRTDLEHVALEDLTLPTDETIAIDTIAERHDAEPEAIRRLLAERASGVISNDRYVPAAVLASVTAEVEAMEDPTVADVTPLLEEHGLAVTALEECGFTVEYTSLNPAAVRVRQA